MENATVLENSPKNTSSHSRVPLISKLRGSVTAAHEPHKLTDRFKSGDRNQFSGRESALGWASKTLTLGSTPKRPATFTEGKLDKRARTVPKTERSHLGIGEHDLCLPPLSAGNGVVRYPPPSRFGSSKERTPAIFHNFDCSHFWSIPNNGWQECAWCGRRRFQPVSSMVSGSQPQNWARYKWTAPANPGCLISRAIGTSALADSSPQSSRAKNNTPKRIPSAARSVRFIAPSPEDATGFDSQSGPAKSRNPVESPQVRASTLAPSIYR